MFFQKVNRYSRILKKKDFTDDNIYDCFEENFSEDEIDDTLDRFLYKLNNPIKNNAKKLLKLMLSFNEKKRPTIAEILKSPLFNTSYLSNVKQKPLLEFRINPIFGKYPCNLTTYEGFDVLVRLSTRVPISLETFFLAVDIYQRSLPVASLNLKVDEKEKEQTEQTENRGQKEQKERINIIFKACLSLYMAIKMLEAYFADTNILADLTGNLFQAKDLVIGEAILTNKQGGIRYTDNLFTSSSTLIRLNEAFELSRNCYIYPKIDFKEWKRLNDVEQLNEPKYNKYMPFNTFLIQTNYYSNFTDISLSYLPVLFEMDSTKFN